MSNHLIRENSPYLLQHAENPVEWYPWGPEALERARLEDRPIFLSIGYAACHWCHVMAHESFEDPRIAALMNANFVNIKVDREERPDLDGIYMRAVTALTGQGGWPMSIFLIPDGQPFFAGTYFPPAPRYNLPAFSQVLLSISQAWKENRVEILKSGQEIAQQLQKAIRSGARLGVPISETLDQATLALAQAYDWTNGGWGAAPKFPQPMAIEFLLCRATRRDALARDMAVHALHAMSQGGIYDVIGGGFARYSVDETWLKPHFEKMLYDNAQLALAYLHAFKICRGEACRAVGEESSDLERIAPAFRRICEATLDFIARELTNPRGGFYSSLDADSEGEEGKFYLWTPEEIREAVGDTRQAAFLIAAYGITEAGNFEGRNILHCVLSIEGLAEEAGLPPCEVLAKLEDLNRRLLAARERRVRPQTDDKVLAGWNALALAAFAEAGRYLGRQDYTTLAVKNAHFLLENLHPEDRLLRSWRDGQAKHNAYLEDYAGLIKALLTLYQSDPDPEWFRWAVKLAGEMIAHLTDPSGGFFDTRDDHETLLYRPKELQDSATPSGNALAAIALLQVASYEGRADWREKAEAMLAAVQDYIAQYPAAFAFWLNAADFALGPVFEAAILGDPSDTQRQELVSSLWQTYRPRLVAAISVYPPEAGSPALLKDRPLQNGQATAYICQGFVCQRPVHSPEEMVGQLEAGVRGPPPGI